MSTATDQATLRSANPRGRQQARTGGGLGIDVAFPALD